MTEKELRLHKILSAADGIISSLITFLLVFHFMGRWTNALNVCVPLLGVNISISAIRFWKSKRIVAVICLCAAIFIFACCIGVFLI